MTATISFHIYKPNSRTLAEYNGGLERVLRYSKLLNDAFRKTHPWLAQRLLLDEPMLADPLLAKAPSARRANAGHC